MTAGPLDYQQNSAAPAGPSPLEQQQAEVDTELDVQAAKEQIAFLRRQNAQMRATLAANEGAQAAQDARLTAALDSGVAEAADAEQELLAAGCVKIQLDLDGDEQTYVWVKPADQWRSSDTSYLAAGNFTAWAQSCLATADDVAEWMDADPSVYAVNEFFARWKQATGQDVGKSSASRRHSRRTRTR